MVSCKGYVVFIVLEPQVFSVPEAFLIMIHPMSYLRKFLHFLI